MSNEKGLIYSKYFDVFCLTKLNLTWFALSLFYLMKAELGIYSIVLKFKFEVGIFSREATLELALSVRTFVRP